MSRRKRLSWKTQKQSKQLKTAGSNWYERTADPYMMNQERVHVPTEDYMTGDPSEWAEDPVEDLSHMNGTERNEIGMPAMDPESWTHKGEDAWGEGEAPYDNDDTFEQREARTVRQAKTRLAKMQRHFEKKALQCVRIAQALLPNATEDVIAQQALDFMPLPDDALIETNLRLENFSVMAEEHEGEEHEGEEHEEGKEASTLSTDQMLRIMEAEEKEKEEGGHDQEEGHDKEEGKGKEASIRTLIAEEIAKALGKVAKDEEEVEEEEVEEEVEEEEGKEAAEEKEVEEAEEGEEGEEAEEVEEEAKAKEAALDIRTLVAEELAKALGTYTPASTPKASGEEYMEEEGLLDEDLDTMLAEMEVGEDMGEEHEVAEMGLELEPQHDAFATTDLLDEGDDTLQALMNQSYGVDAMHGKQASSKKKVNQLGRVKEAGTTDGGSGLEGLWESAPDVSKVFS